MWNYNNTPNNELCHYGVLGMKWGKRKAKSTISDSTKKSKKKQKEDISKLSDSELRQRINRIQMEKQYKQLTTPEKSYGQKFVQNVLTNAAQQTASKYVSQYMNKGVESLLKQTLKK